MTTSVNKMKLIRYTILWIMLLPSCRKYVEIDPPRTALVKSTVFENDATAEAAMLDVYYLLSQSSFADGRSSCISLLMSFYSDESINYVNDLDYQQLNENTMLSGNGRVLTMWTSLYNCLYRCNAIVEGAQASGKISASLKDKLIGEAKFIRAFCHFYLTNLWGDVPLVTTTDYQVNSRIARTAEANVYQQIITDLTDAQNLLPADHALTNGLRIRVSKGAATALLARVYLYKKEWANAETQATSVINNTALYTLEPELAKVFRNTGKEAILQFWSNVFPYDRGTFFTRNADNALREEYMNSFETGDQRKAVWILNRVVSGNTYYLALKYRDFSDPPLDYTTVLRLAEQYLIRAEARAQLNKIAGAQADINAIRNRASLANTTATTQPALLLAIEQERKAELFTEWGHRWFDLKRTGRASAVLSPLKPQWKATAVLFPIPESERFKNDNLTQNAGY